MDDHGDVDESAFEVVAADAIPCGAKNGQADNGGANTRQLRRRRGRGKSNEAVDDQVAKPEDNDGVVDEEGDCNPDPSNGLDQVNSNDDDEVVEEETTRSGKKRRRSSEGPKGRGPEENRTCPHCRKVIVSIHGLKYHVGA